MRVERPQSRPHYYKARSVESPQSRPHWLLLIYSFQFRSAARATPAPCTPNSTTPTSITHQKPCGVNNSIDIMQSLEYMVQLYSALHSIQQPV